MVVKKYKIGDIRYGSQVLNPKDRKTILFIADLHLRHSGVGSQKKQIIYGTCHRYNYIDLGYIQNYDFSKTIITDMSKEIESKTGVEGADVKVIPYNIYDKENTQKLQSDLLQIIDQFKPDALYHFTDPHSWYWMYEIESLIRSKIPIIYYNIWDNLPYPKYNQRYYSCSDLIMNISKQTQNIVNQVCVNYKREDWQTKYVPHGINMETFKPMSKRNPVLKNLKKQLNVDNFDFILLFVNKNIVRKQAVLIMQAWKYFVKEYLTKQERQKALLIMKTQINYGPGMPLKIYAEDVIQDDEVNIMFLDTGLEQEQLCALYNLADGVVSYSTAQGFGLTTAEGLACGIPFIAPVMGGLQDQMGFEDKDGNLYVNNIQLPSNCYAKHTKHKSWVYPVFPKATGATGSMITPYIYQMYASLEDMVQAMRLLWNTPKEQRQKIGLQGRNWMQTQEVRMSSELMCKYQIKYIDEMFQNWKPKSKINMFKAQPINKKTNSGSYNPVTKRWE